MDYLIKESQFLQLMTRLLIVGILTALVVSAVPFSHAAEIKELETGILFGGLHGMANETIAANMVLAFHRHNSTNPLVSAKLQ